MSTMATTPTITPEMVTRRREGTVCRKPGHPYADAVRMLSDRLRLYLGDYTALARTQHYGDPHNPSASHAAAWQRLNLERRHGASRGCRTVDLAFLGYQAARSARELTQLVGGDDGVLTLPQDVRKLLADVDERAIAGANGFTVIGGEGCGDR